MSGSAALDASTIEAPAATAHRDRLANHAAVLEAWLARPEGCPPRWRLEKFARLVDLVRSHLRPLGSRDLLAHSYSREHFHVRAVGAQPAPALLLARDATEVAYALRWLELGEGRGRESWALLLGGR